MKPSKLILMWMVLLMLTEVALIFLYINFDKDLNPSKNCPGDCPKTEIGRNSVQHESAPRDINQDLIHTLKDLTHILKDLTHTVKEQQIKMTSSDRSTDLVLSATKSRTYKPNDHDNFQSLVRTFPTLRPSAKHFLENVRRKFTRPPQFTAMKIIQHLGTIKTTLETTPVVTGKSVAKVSKPTANPRKDFHVSKTSAQRDDKVKTILIYTPYFDKIPWPYRGFRSGEFFLENNGSRCAKACRITYSRSMLRQSDAVIFHANDMAPFLKQLQVINRQRTQTQRWVFLALENPKNSYTSAGFDGIFNWTSTYRTDSDVYMPYNNYQRIPPTEIPKGHFNRNYAEGKTRLVAWAVGHCQERRDKIVHKLLKFINITVFGACSDIFKQSNRGACPRGTKQCSHTLKTFKFYLSFENELCKDYITEKYWETPLEHEMVPIVFGATYNDNNTIPGSYINVLDFPSIEALAKYIKYLDNNDTAYNEYFQWKSRYKVQNHSWRCMLCNNLYNDALPPKVYKNFLEFWSWETNCNDGEISKKFQALVN